MANYFETVVERLTPKNDLDWINLIYQYLIEFYAENKENIHFRDKNENAITNEIYFWLKNKQKFTRIITVSSQPRTDNTEIEGYYDLKFDSPLWNDGQTHFSMENKISINTETSLKDYTYYPSKTKGKGENKKIFDDGGIYRFLSNKYADKQPYGGMLAFVKQNNTNEITDKLKDKIKNLIIIDYDKQYGQLIDRNLLDVKILDFENSFQTNHTRKDGTNIHLFHLLFQCN